MDISGNNMTSGVQDNNFIKKIQSDYEQQNQQSREVKKTLGKDDFLKMMLVQMKHQDPTSPFSSEKMATEMAQFTSVEQLQNINQNLMKIESEKKPLEQLLVANLLGKVVTVDRQKFSHREGQAEELSFTLLKDSAKTKVSIENELGEEIFKKDLSSQKSGEVVFNWDGLKANGLPSKTGLYRFKIEAQDFYEKEIPIQLAKNARVMGVSFDSTGPVIFVGDGNHQDRVMMQNIARVQLDSEQNLAK